MNRRPFLIILFFLLLLAFIPIHYYLIKPGALTPRSPDKVVALFDQVYGSSEMSSIAPYTTGRFRDKKRKEVWIADTWKTLKKIEYKRLSSKLINSSLKGNQAMVVLQSQIETVAGKTDQKEIFYLIKKDGIWKIDELVVTDEKLEKRKEKYRGYWTT